MSKKIFVSITLLDTYEPEDVELSDDCDDEEFQQRVETQVDQMIESLGITPNDIEYFLSTD